MTEKATYRLNLERPRPLNAEELKSLALKIIAAKNNGNQVPKEGHAMHGEVKEPATMFAKWEAVVKSPQEYLENFEGIMFAAGGALPTVFGDETKYIWQQMQAAAQSSEDEREGVGEDGESKRKLTIAGIEFEMKQLAEMGSFYQWLRDKKNIKFHCIDERLAEATGPDGRHNQSQVHSECGACAAVAGTVSGILKMDKEDYEEKLSHDVGESVEGKQRIVATMPHHASLTEFVDFSTIGRALKPEKRSEFEAIGGLPFNITLPLEWIKEYCDQYGVDARSLIKTLVLWNVQIARNIIGSHNDLVAAADQTRLIVDESNVPDTVDNLRVVALAEMAQVVPPANHMKIAAID